MTSSDRPVAGACTLPTAVGAVTDLRLALRSGDVARAAGVNQQTLRYYERRGLLKTWR